MQREDQIIDMLEGILSKLDERSKSVENHSFRDGNREPAEKNDGILKDLATQIELLREDVWQNRVDIHRIKNKLGIK
ncbi:hypothetical protein J2Z83_001319 [Virgibacillus natechei]|uniref:Uncharacterized protein n=1 Tax=Virgibacillus natechei TaxID=1216297 RepID=A0ABS4IF19_9BACI|nr:hypothetical protein [Virgibacillus natechei]MBP1969215.1 hypothetical protein [Virgibacillus natechei]UZD12379.1 hypothetical protein OLD84_15915 [Virgibacillus natechei]